MKIGELAQATGFSPKTIRFYEQEDLLPLPGRTESGYRVYAAQDIQRLEFIRKAKRLGLSLEEIRGIFQIHDRREVTCMHVRDLLDEKLAQVDTVLKDLQAFRQELARLQKRAGAIEDCRPAGGRICGIIENSASVAGERALARLRPGTEQRS